MKMKPPEKYKRNSVFMEFGDNHDYIEVTEWANQDGKDVMFSVGSQEKRISLTHDEFEAMMVAWNFR